MPDFAPEELALELALGLELAAVLDVLLDVPLLEADPGVDDADGVDEADEVATAAAALPVGVLVEPEAVTAVLVVSSRVPYQYPTPRTAAALATAAA